MKIVKGLCAAALCAFTVATTASAATVVLHGSTTVKNQVFEPFGAQIESSSGVTVEVVGNGSTNGLLALANGTADIGMISAPLDSTISKAKKKDAGFVGTSLIAHQIGESRVAFIRNAGNGVNSMTMEQVKKVLSGEIKNWSEVGGANMPIVIVTEKPGNGTRTMAEKAVLDGESITSSARAVPSLSQVAKVVSQIPNAFGVSTATLLSAAAPEITTDGTVAQPLILVTDGAPNSSAQALIDAAKNALN